MYHYYNYNPIETGKSLTVKSYANWVQIKIDRLPESIINIINIYLVWQINLFLKPFLRASAMRRV